MRGPRVFLGWWVRLAFAVMVSLPADDRPRRALSLQPVAGGR